MSCTCHRHTPVIYDWTDIDAVQPSAGQLCEVRTGRENAMPWEAVDAGEALFLGYDNNNTAQRPYLRAVWGRRDGGETFTGVKYWRPAQGLTAG